MPGPHDCPSRAGPPSLPLPCPPPIATRRCKPPMHARTSTNSDPTAEKNGTPASPATARAMYVFPVPGGPWKMMPRGTRAPIARYSGSPSSILTTSRISTTMWSRPAMSSKRTAVSRILPVFSSRVMNSRAVLAVSFSHMLCSLLFFFCLRSRHIFHAGVAVRYVSSIVQPRPKTQNAAAFS
eukprot:350494-Chlamydomonas_euryale.AAC.21